MLASSVCATDSPTCNDIAAKGNLKPQQVGSDSYQQTHMGLIFGERMSFSGFERNKVFLANKNGYSDLSRISGADSESDCRAVLVADFDDDGDCDIFTTAIQHENHHLFRNDLPRDAAHRSIKIKLRATRGHPDAIGATVVMQGPQGPQAQVLACGSGFESQSADEIVFGLGRAESARVSVRWPGRPESEAEAFGILQPGRYLLIEGEGNAAGRAEQRSAKSFDFGDPPPRGVTVRAGASLTHLDLLTVDGKPHREALATGLPVVINFWSTTCASCLAEMPELARLHRSNKYRVIAICLDRADRIAVIEKHRKRLQMPFDVFRIDDEQASALFDVFRLAIPVTIIVKNGRIERILQGKIEKGDF